MVLMQMNEVKKEPLIRKAKQRVTKIIPFALVFLIGYSFHACSPKNDMYVDEASWMPEGASDGIRSIGGTFILGPPMYCYEYDISEADFVNYTQEEGKELTEILETEYIRRYLVYHVRHDEFKHLRNDLDASKEYQKMTYAKIDNGLIYRKIFEDQEYACAYDRDRGRAFIYIQTR